MEEAEETLWDLLSDRWGHEVIAREVREVPTSRKRRDR
jgi:hypothetical protein